MTESARQWGHVFESGSLNAMDAYDRIVARAFEEWGHDMVERLAPLEGKTVLEVACGSGTVTLMLAEAAGPTGRVIGADISPSMLAVARGKAATGAPIDWRESPAAPLAVETGSVDAIACQQGLQFFPDKVAALREMRRALASDGRGVVSVWTQVEDQDFWGSLQASIAAVWSAELAERYRGPFSLAGETAAELAKEAGFANVTLERATLPGRLYGGAPALVESLVAAGIAPDFAELDDAGRARLLAEVERRTKHLARGGDLYGTGTASVLTLS